jgi:hypothetical protein
MGHPRRRPARRWGPQGEFAADFEEVTSFLELYNVEYFWGPFPNAVPAAGDDTHYAFVHLAADAYQSGLEYFLPVSSRTEFVSWMMTVGSFAPKVELAVRHICPDVEVQTGQHQAWFRK